MQEELKDVARDKGKGIKLKVFTGREATLNRTILSILHAKGPLICYDAYLQVRRVKGFRHTGFRTVERRMKALEKQSWIERKGTRPTKPGWESALYAMTIRGKAALKLDNLDIDVFLETSQKRQLVELVSVLSMCTERDT